MFNAKVGLFYHVGIKVTYTLVFEKLNRNKWDEILYLKTLLKNVVYFFGICFERKCIEANKRDSNLCKKK